MHQFSLTPSINDKIFKIGILYGRISALRNHAKWFPRLARIAAVRGGIAAISIDKDIFEKIDLIRLEQSTNPENTLKNLFNEYKPYISAKEYLMKEKGKTPLSLEFLNTIHAVLAEKKG